MKNKKLIILLILSIFIIGMVLSPASASHTFKVGKYKATVSNSQYKKLQRANEYEDFCKVKVKTKNTYKAKKPVYKTKKVKKWKYKKVLDNEFVYYPNGCDFHDYKTMKKYTKKGWEWCGSSYKTIDYGDGYSTTKYYYKFKKKVTVNKKVKVGSKKVNKHYTMVIDSDGFAKVYKGSKFVKSGSVKIR